MQFRIVVMWSMAVLYRQFCLGYNILVRAVRAEICPSDLRRSVIMHHGVCIPRLFSGWRLVSVVLSVLLQALSLMCWSVASWADIYQWRDEHGRVFFGEKPPDEALDVRQIGSDSTATKRPRNSESFEESGDWRARQQKMLEYYEQRRRRSDTEKSAIQERRRKLREACARAREQSKRMQRGGRYYEEQGDNGHRYLSDAEVLKLRKKAEAIEKRVCGGGG